MISPCQLEVLIHFHINPTPHPRLSAPAVRDAIEFLLRNDMISEIGGDAYTITTKGVFWLGHILSVPLPAGGAANG